MEVNISQQATIFNASSVGVIVAISTLVHGWFPRPFFVSWTFAYVAGLVVLCLEIAMAFLGEAPALVAIGASAVVLDGLALTHTALTLRGARPTRGPFVAIWLLGSAVFGAFAFAGFSHMAVYVAPALGLAGSFVYLGGSFFNNRILPGSRGVPWLAWPLMGLGVWLLTYPVLVPSSLTWAGYWVSGVLNLWVGVGMLVYLLLTVAAELRLRNEELKQVDVLKTNFLNTISHEIRTPLNSIRTATSLMDRADVLEQGTLMRTVDANVVRLDRMLGDILDFARLESNYQSYAYTELDLGDVAMQARDAFAAVARDQDIRFEDDIQEASIPVRVDADRIAQAIGNLLNNAARFTPAGGTIALRVRQAGDKARIEVEDTGIGIAPENLTKVFARFFQVDGGETRKVGGAGLGLSITKKIVEEGHHGRIWAESEPGRGARFVIELPLSAPATGPGPSS